MHCGNYRKKRKGILFSEREKASHSFPFCTGRSLCLHAMQTRPWVKTSAYANFIFCMGSLWLQLDSAWDIGLQKLLFFLKTPAFKNQSTNPGLQLSSFHSTEQAGWNCLSALQEGELELMLWKLAVLFPWNTDIFRLQHFDVSFKNKQADTISIFLQSWCFSKRSLFSLGWHTILEDQLCAIITKLPIKAVVPDILYCIPLLSWLHWEHHLHDPHFSYSPTQVLHEGNTSKDSSANREENRLRWWATEHTPVSTA